MTLFLPAVLLVASSIAGSTAWLVRHISRENRRLHDKLDGLAGKERTHAFSKGQ